MMNIFDFIDNKSLHIAKKIGKNETDEDIELYYYAIFGIFSQIFTFGFGIIISYFLGILSEYLISTTTFVLLRIGLGGYHCPTFKSCFIFSNTIFFVCAIISIILNNFCFVLFFISFIVGAIFVRRCPVVSENSPSRGRKKDLYFKKKYKITLALFIILNFILIKINMYTYSCCISNGIILSCFMASEYSKKIIEKITCK